MSTDSNQLVPMAVHAASVMIGRPEVEEPMVPIANAATEDVLVPEAATAEQ